ncbi:unnamed protein product [Blepharisma stoltei]|uniref:Uncharacterized protein n=1 Tax=Blepharisma stoltei TaxID=1481888 RepID=A0AAU9K294_9CILI|nr:unnamed protein product [Blepharisma stoltei]
MSDDLKIGVTEYFVASILNEGKLNQDFKSSIPREIAKRILKEKKAQKIILSAFVKLYPYMSGEIAKFQKRKTQTKNKKIDEAELEQQIFIERSGSLFLNNYRLIQQQVASLKTMIAKESNKDEAEAEKNLNENNKKGSFHNDRIVSLLTEITKIQPITMGEFQEISNEAWSRHMELEKLLREEVKKYEYKFNRVDAKYMYKFNWIKEKAGVKIDKLEKTIEENWEKYRVDIDRVAMTLEDEYSIQNENYAKEESEIARIITEEGIDLESMGTKYKEILSVKRILEKKLTQAEKIIKGLDGKLRTAFQTLRNLEQQNSSHFAKMKMLTTCFLLLIDKSRLISDHKEKCRMCIAEERYDVLEKLFLEGEVLESPLQEFLIKRLYDVREALGILSLATNEEATRMRVSKILNELRVDNIITDGERQRYEKIANLQELIEQEHYLMLQKSKSPKKNRKKSLRRRVKTPQNERIAEIQDIENLAQVIPELGNGGEKSDKNEKISRIKEFLPKHEALNTNLSTPKGRETYEAISKKIEDDATRDKSTGRSKANHHKKPSNVPKLNTSAKVSTEETKKSQELLKRDISYTNESPSTMHTERFLDQQNKEQTQENFYESLSNNEENKYETEEEIRYLGTELSDNDEIKSDSEENYSDSIEIANEKESIGNDKQRRRIVTQVVKNDKGEIVIQNVNINKNLKIKYKYHPQSFEGKIINIISSDLLENKKISEASGFKDFLRLEIKDDMKVKDLILAAIAKYFAKKENQSTQTEIDLDILRNYKASQKEQATKDAEDSSLKFEQKSAFGKLFYIQSLTKYYTARQSVLAQNSSPMAKEYTKRVFYAAEKYGLEFDKQIQKLNAMPEEDECDNIWEKIINRRVSERRKDAITNYLCNFIATDQYAERAYEVILLLKQHNIYKLAFIIHYYLTKEQQPIGKWRRLMQSVLKYQAKNLGKNFQNCEDYKEIWYNLAKNIKYVSISRPKLITPKVQPELQFKSKRTVTPSLRSLKKTTNSPFSKSVLMSTTPQPQTKVSLMPKYQLNIPKEQKLYSTQKIEKQEEEDARNSGGLSARTPYRLPLLY